MKWEKIDKKRLLDLLLVLVGNVCYVCTVKLFVLPQNLISCGTTGLGLVVNHLTGLPLTTFIFLFNVAMLAVGWWVFGTQFAMTTIFSSLFYPVALEGLNLLLGDIAVTQNMLLNVIFAGLGLGGSLGLVVRGGASTGGMDIPPLVLRKFLHIPVSVSLWVLDFCIMLSQMAFHPVEDLLYGVIQLILISTMLNKVLMFGNSRTEVKIVSEAHEKIRQAILSQVDRGCTLLHGRGGYMGKETEVILSVVSNHELPKIEQLARAIDPSCFIIVSQVTEVWGRGFSYAKQHAEPPAQK